MVRSSKCVDDKKENSRHVFDYFTIWTLVFLCITLFLCIILPNKLPLWLLVGVSSQMVTVWVMGSFFFNSVCLYNGNKTELSDAQVISRDFFLHLLPVIILFMFYGFFEKRFFYSISMFKSSILPLILSIIYLSIYNIQDVYYFTEFSTRGNNHIGQ